MAETIYGTNVITVLRATPVSLATPGMAGGRVHKWVDTCEMTAAAAAGSTYTLAYIPSHAIIFGSSKLYFDDLASTGSPTLDIGVAPLRTGDFTADPDALNDGIDCATAAGSASLIKSIANYGKRLWQIAGLTEDPKCDMAVYVSLLDAAANTGGTLTMEVDYAVD